MAAWKGTIADVSVVSDVTGTITTIPIREGASQLWIEVLNSAHKAFDAFQLQLGPYSDTTFHTIASLPSDFTTSAVWPIRNTSVDPTTLALSTNTVIGMDCRGLSQVRIKGSSAAGSDTTVTVNWSMR